jgi:hypothetical protein
VFILSTEKNTNNVTALMITILIIIAYSMSMENDLFRLCNAIIVKNENDIVVLVAAPVNPKIGIRIISNPMLMAETIILIFNVISGRFIALIADPIVDRDPKKVMPNINIAKGLTAGKKAGLSNKIMISFIINVIAIPKIDNNINEYLKELLINK